MKAILALGAFLVAAVHAQPDPACVAIYPNTKCRFAEAVEKPIIVSNLECGTCYSSSVLQNLLREADFPLTDANPTSYKELYSGFDFTVDCADETVSVYRAISPTTPRCAGPVRVYDNSTCVRLGDSSMRGAPGPCNYTLKSGYEETPQPANPEVCGTWGYTWESTCDECLELWLSSPLQGYQYYMTSCANGTTSIYTDSECLERNTNVDPIPMSACHYYPGDVWQSAHMQVLPVFYEETRLCRVWYGESSDCTGPIDYIDCDSGCGGCYQSGTELFGEPAHSIYTSCDDLSSVFYKDYLCNDKLSAPVAFQNCVTVDGGSFRTGTLAEYD